MINWRVRIKNKNFWITIIPAILLLLQTVIYIFGYTLNLNELGDKLLAVINSLFLVLSILGIVNDPTTEGIGDSTLAMSYDIPKIKEKV